MTADLWNGQYGSNGSTYYLGGKQYMTPQALPGYNANDGNLPYGTTVYSPGATSGMNTFDPTVQNNPTGALSGGSMFAPPVTPGTVPPGTATPPPYQAGSLMPSGSTQTPADVFNPLTDPTQAVYRGLQAQGYNPDFQTWGIQQMLRRAEDLVYGAAGRAVRGGQSDMLAGPGYQAMINALVQRAGSGAGGVFGSPDEGRLDLNAINGLLSQGRTGGAGLGARYLNAQFGTSPEHSAALANALLYSGLNPDVRRAVGLPLAAFPSRFAQYTETPTGFGEATNRSTLDILLSQLVPNYHPFG